MNPQTWRWASRVCKATSTTRNQARVQFQPISRPGQPRYFSSTPRQNAYVRFSTPGDRRPNFGRRNDPRDWRTWDTRTRFIIGTGAVGTAYYLYHQEQVPDTGRWRFMNTSPEAEAQLGEELYKEMRREFGPRALPESSAINKHVRRVASRLLHASNLGVLRGESKSHSLPLFGLADDDWNPDVHYGAAQNPAPVYGPEKEWNLLVVNDPKTVNAMAIPGTIVVFTGILNICQDEEGLAAVLAHEIGHVVARHTAERMSGETFRFLAAGLLSYVLGIDFGITNTFNTLFLALPNSRTQEREADLIGLRLMSRACYDPAASPQVFSRLAKVEGKIASMMNHDFLRTHPSSESRVKALEEALPQAYDIMTANPECQAVRMQIEALKARSRAIRPGEGGWEFA